MLLRPEALHIKTAAGSPSKSRERKKPRTEIGTDTNNLSAPSTRVEVDQANEECTLKTPERGRSAQEAYIAEDSQATESPSPEKILGDAKRKTNKDGSQQPEPRIVIDLTTPERRATASYPTPNSRPVRVNHFQTNTLPIASRSDSPKPDDRFGSQLERPPHQIRAPNPQGSQQRFTTHLTGMLESLAKDGPPTDEFPYGSPPLLNHFQPAVVSRDIKVLERGFWQFVIRVAEQDAVDASRRPKPILKILGSTARKKHMAPPSPCTEDEFVDFWKSMKLVIESGQAGLATQMTKEPEGEGIWRIRLFTWGELVGHTWVLLCVFLHRVVETAYMEWLAADGAVVVKMSYEKRQSGIWKRKGPEGQKGRWFFEQG